MSNKVTHDLAMAYLADHISYHSYSKLLPVYKRNSDPNFVFIFFQIF